MGKIIRDGNVISSYNYEKTVDQSDFITMITRPANTNIVVPEGVEKIGNYAFYNYTTLKEISLPDSITSIGNSAFARCFDMSLTGNKLPKNLTSIGDSTFLDAQKIIIEDMPLGLTSLPQYAFYECTSLTKLKLNSVTSLGDSCFSYCKNLTDVEFGDNFTTIKSAAFRGTNLSQVTLPTGVMAIPRNCFENNKSMTKAIFKGNITNIASQAFNGCTNLTKFTFPNNTTVPTLENINAIPNGVSYTGTIEVPSTLLEEWKQSTNWVSLSSVIWVGI